MTHVHVWSGTYDRNGTAELRALPDSAVIQMTAAQLRALCMDSLGLCSLSADAIDAARSATNGNDAVNQLLDYLAQWAEPNTKPFAAPGAWFPTTVLGSPMRPLDGAAGTWEVAVWPSELAQAKREESPRPAVKLNGVGAYPSV